MDCMQFRGRAIGDALAMRLEILLHPRSSTPKGRS